MNEYSDQADTSILTLERAAVGRPITRMGVSFFPVYLPENYLPEIATGQNSDLTIEELDDSTVPFLKAKNTADLPVLIPEGEQLVGGLQDRVLNISVLVAASVNLNIPVSCIEMGRWGNRRGFERGRAYAPRRTRRAKNASVAHSIRREGSHRSDQAAVWNSVDAELSMVGVASPTSAVRDAEQLLYADRRRAEAIEHLARIGPLPGQCGVLVAHGKRVVAIDIFDNHQLLVPHWDGLIRSYLMEEPSSGGYPSATRALWALGRFSRAPAVGKSGVGLGVELHVETKRLVGQALTLNRAVVHASAFMTS